MFDITLSPSTSEITILPGFKYLLAFNIQNNSDSTITLNSSIESWQPKGNEGLVYYTDNLKDTTINFNLNNSNLKLGQPFILKQQEKKQLVLKIDTQNITSIKDHYYTFFISDISNNQTKAKIGAHIIISTEKKQNQNLSISDFKIKPFFKDCLIKPISISATAINSGNQLGKINGKLIISRNNLTIKEYYLSSDTVLSNTKRVIRCATKEAEIVPCSLNTPIWPGYYKIYLTLNQEKPVSYETGFFVLPYSIILFIGIIVTIFLLFYRRLRRR